MLLCLEQLLNEGSHVGLLDSPSSSRRAPMRSAALAIFSAWRRAPAQASTLTDTTLWMQQSRKGALSLAVALVIGQLLLLRFVTGQSFLMRSRRESTHRSSTGCEAASFDDRGCSVIRSA